MKRDTLNNNQHFVLPRVYWTGKTVLNMSEVERYLRDTDQEEFLKDIEQARAEGLSDGEILCSLYAKLCYKSLVVGKNDNITRVRGIADNIESTIESLHGSVFEHCTLNFVVTDCSRIFTHEQVRHRVGTAYSQTSGRYVRSDELDIVVDPILAPIYNEVEEVRQYIESWYNRSVDKLGLDQMKNFDAKKKMTSALRRLMPNGQANEIGESFNLRSTRHMIELRTSGGAEWEMRLVYGQIFDLINASYPAIFADAEIKTVNELREITFKNRKI